MRKILLTTAALGFAAAMSAGAITATAAPIAPSGAQVNIATPNDDVVQVQRRRRGRWVGPAVGVGIGLGILGAAAAANAYPYGYYGPGPYGPGRCWVQTGPYRGQGYWTYC
jgi:hypothetical protein